MFLAKQATMDGAGRTDNEKWKLAMEAYHQNRRRHERAIVTLTAEIAIGETCRSCDVINISPGGAKLRSDGRLKTGQQLTLLMGDMSPLQAEVRWSNGDKHGLRFTDDAETIGATIMALASYGAVRA